MRVQDLEAGGAEFESLMLLSATCVTLGELCNLLESLGFLICKMGEILST